MLLKQTVADALNKQVEEEFFAAAQYLAIALYYDRETLPGLSSYFHAQSTEEYGHALKILQYLNDAGAMALVPGTREPNNSFSKPIECVELALQQELHVTDLINRLVDLAVQENDHLTRDFLQWFVTEQLEEVSSISDLLNVMKYAGDNVLLVEDYLARNPRPDAGGSAGAAGAA
jgi:ferritin